MSSLTCPTGRFQVTRLTERAFSGRQTGIVPPKILDFQFTAQKMFPYVLSNSLVAP